MAGFTIATPPLRERSSDLDGLAQHFLSDFRARYGVYTEFSPRALGAVHAYDWPGNVRELRAVVQQAAVLASGDRVGAAGWRARRVPDLVISDLQMADMDGFALLAWLLSERAHVLSFAMTAHASEETQERLRELGAVECFSKPLDVDALVARIADSLSQNIRGHVHNVGLVSFLLFVAEYCAAA